MAEPNAILNAFLLSLLAGMGTGLGGLIAIFSKPGKRTFGFLMGITAGVMLTLAFHELVNEAWELQGFIKATIGFAAGATFMLVLDILIPHIRFGERETTLFEQPIVQEINQVSSFWRRRHRGRDHHGGKVIDQKLLKTGTLLAIGITIHNIPEGIAVGAGYMHFPEFGLFIAMAILVLATCLIPQVFLCFRQVFRWPMLPPFADMPVNTSSLGIVSFTSSQIQADLMSRSSVSVNIIHPCSRSNKILVSSDLTKRAFMLYEKVLLYNRLFQYGRKIVPARYNQDQYR